MDVSNEDEKADADDDPGGFNDDIDFKDEEEMEILAWLGVEEFDNDAADAAEQPPQRQSRRENPDKDQEDD
jgi:hypothetical protein